ncbi:hypothetical protein L596_030340 [Steinernema carpocapsae]|uniref:Nudix hydrolase domain-containing protein n=1 Tax=Steinernema carpocapsae TaxID=34508 RepID=A0A4U5LP34_STECR|nr:hypothetical protein L596_030340 [Steinernema carpocapsae]
MQSLRASLRHHHTTANLLLSQTGKEAFLQRLAEAQIASAGKPKLRAAKRGGAPKKNDSSVLIPLVEQEKRIWIILTQRSFQLNSHRGEICFPGGKIEHGEDLAQAALRESFEETGMEPSKVNVWGALNPVLNRYLTNSVTPVVGPEFVEFEKLQRGTTHELNKRLFDLIFEADCVHFWDRIPAVCVLDPAHLPSLAPHCAEVRSIFMVPVDEICAKSGYTNFQHKSFRYVLPVFQSSEYRMLATSDSCISGYKEPPVQRIWGLSACAMHQMLLNLVPELYDSKLAVPF